jgi:hypothetical protein
MTQCLNNLRQIGIGVKLYVDDNHGTFPWIFAYDPDTQRTYMQAHPPVTLGGNDPDVEHSGCFIAAKLRPLFNYLKPSEVYRCPVDKGRIADGCCDCSKKPAVWETVGCSYDYNAARLTYLTGGGFKEEPEDKLFGLSGKPETWAPSPERYILLHEPPARMYGCLPATPRWYQWHFLRGPSDIEDPQTARQEFISPIAFVDGHVAQHNFSKSLSTDPYFPYEPTKHWIWYKPSANAVAQR